LLELFVIYKAQLSKISDSVKPSKLIPDSSKGGNPNLAIESFITSIKLVSGVSESLDFLFIYWRLCLDLR